MNNTNDIVFTLFGLGFTWEGIGIAIAAFFSFLSFGKGIIESKSQNKYLEKSININYITDKRVEWINRVREVAAEYITNVYDVTADLLNSGSTSGDKINQINKNSSLLILLLNFAGDIDSAIIQIIYNIYGNIRNSEFEEAQTQIAYFKAHIQIYLKLEWNRVKSEVKTGIYDENQRCKETLELYDKFLNANQLDKLKVKDVYEKLKQKYSHVT
jgi:hypothetical protein